MLLKLNTSLIPNSRDTTLIKPIAFAQDCQDVGILKRRPYSVDKRVLTVEKNGVNSIFQAGINRATTCLRTATGHSGLMNQPTTGTLGAAPPDPRVQIPDFKI